MTNVLLSYSLEKSETKYKLYKKESVTNLRLGEEWVIDYTKQCKKRHKRNIDYFE